MAEEKKQGKRKRDIRRPGQNRQTGASREKIWKVPTEARKRVARRRCLFIIWGKGAGSQSKAVVRGNLRIKFKPCLFRVLLVFTEKRSGFLRIWKRKEGRPALKIVKR